MPDVPTNLNLIIDRFQRSIYLTVNLLLAIGPELFPSEYLRVIQKQSPERYEVSIAWSLIAPRRTHKLIQLYEALQRSLDINTSPSSLDATILAETGDLSSAIEPAVTGTDCIVERPLSLRAPHHAVHFV